MSNDFKKGIIQIADRIEASSIIIDLEHVCNWALTRKDFIKECIRVCLRNKIKIKQLNPLMTIHCPLDPSKYVTIKTVHDIPHESLPCACRRKGCYAIAYTLEIPKEMILQ